MVIATLAAGPIHLPHVAWPWIIIALAVSMIGIAKSGFGGGLGLIVVPVTTLALAAIPGYKGDDALGLLLPLLIVGDVIAVWQYRKFPAWRLIGRLAPGTAIGICIGTGLIWWLKNQQHLAAALINMEIGFESVLLVSLVWWRKWRGIQQKLLPEPTRALATGTFAGASSTLAHAAGPIVAMYLLPLNLGRQVMVATSATFFFFANTAKLPTYYFAGLFDKIDPLFAMRFFPMVLGGAIFGRWLCRRMSDAVFTQVVYVTVFFLGLFLFGRGLLAIIQPT